MNGALQQSLAALPARQLNLLAIGAVAIVTALVWTLAIRAPLGALRVQQVQLAALAASGAGAAAPQAPLAAAVPPAPVVAPAPLELIAAVSASARASGIAVGSATPGPERSVAGMHLQTLDIEASGSYAAILDWLGAIEAAQPAVGFTRLSLRPAQDDVRTIQLQLGTYAQESKP
jgi:type II secretory pathway component PulM